MSQAQEEVLQLLELIQLERSAEKNLIEEQIRILPLEERKKRGLTWAPMILRSQEFGVGGYLRLTLQKTIPDDYPTLFESGQVAFIEPLQNFTSNKSLEGISGIIIKAQKGEVALAVDNEDLPEWLFDSKFSLNYYYDDKTFKAMENAVMQVARAEKGRIAELREILLGFSSPSFNSYAKEVRPNLRLNPSQNAAVNLINQSLDACIIHGPPGTGKTTTLVEAILQTLQKENKILVTAPSNLAVDLLVEKLVENQVKVIRIGHPVRISESVQTHTLDSFIAAHYAYPQIKQLRDRANQLKTNALKYRRAYVKGERQVQLAEVRAMLWEAKDIEKFIIQDVIEKADVIAATPVGCTFQELKDIQFSTVFIDEAAQLLEPAAWIIILKAKKVVFAGDHFQLPPTVKSPEAEKKGLGITLFEKFYQRQTAPARQLLNIQYRMHQAIMSFSNEQFYKNELQSSPTVSQRKLFAGDNPITFIDTAGCSFGEEINLETKSYFNLQEATLLYRHLHQYLQLLVSFTSYKPTVGIISPYKEQVFCLKEQFVHFPDISSQTAYLSIDSIDGFQGQERDIIYISLVRSNSEGQIGFLADTRRINVALTRAKYKLVVIGDSATLGNHKFYEALIDYFQRHNAYISAWEVMAF